MGWQLMSVVYAKIKPTNEKKEDKMNRLHTLAIALDLLKKEYKPEIATAMMYGFVSVMVSDDDALKILEIVKERYVK
jgi:tRNA A-37 threonylcarbamoyl transferase component Bud32